MLTILSVAYPFAPVSLDTAGGAEQVHAILDRALVRAGHRSINIGCAGSKVYGELIETAPVPARVDEQQRLRAHELYRQAITTALVRWPVDLVHFHGIDFYTYLPPPGVPALCTIHGPFDWYPEVALNPSRPETYLNGVSPTQMRTAPSGVELLPPITNGISIEDYDGRYAKRPFALALGRICREKGFHLALDAAKLAGIGLLLAGRVFPYEDHEAHFRQEIAPRLDVMRRFIGPVGLTRKRRLLAAARCLLVPSLIPETGSLVAMEALASGTPVIAFPSGALAEVVEHGRTGFLVNDVREMAEAIRAVGTIDPDICREAARTRFSAARMSQDYFALYRHLMQRQQEAAA